MGKIVLSLLGAGGLTTIVVALINRGSDEKKPQSPTITQTATDGGTAFIANQSNVTVNARDPEAINLLKEIRDSLAPDGKQPLPAAEAQAQREAIKTLEAQPDLATFRLSVDAPKWLRIAFAEIGEAEVEGAEGNPRILQYLAATNLEIDQLRSDETPWSGCFISWVLQQAGYGEVPRSGMIRSYITWGAEVATPTLGTIVLLDWSRMRGGGVPTGHGGFWLMDLGDKALIIGGNVRNAVRIQAVPKKAIYAYRMPPKV